MDQIRVNMIKIRILASRDAPLVSLLTCCRMNGVTSLPFTPDLLKTDDLYLHSLF